MSYYYIFMSELFRGIEQFDVKLQEAKVKVPIFYYDVSAFVNMFLASSKKIRKYVKDKRIKIAELFPGITLLGITCFEYRKTDIGPYNEIGITVPFGDRASLKDILSSLVSGKFEVHVWHLPVTTEIAYIAGVQIYNYPKFVSEIKYSDKNFSLALNGKRILEVVETDGKMKIHFGRKKFHFITYQIKDDSLIKASVDAVGEGVSVSFLSTKVFPDPTTQIGKELEDVIIHKTSVFSMKIPYMNSILYLPTKA